MFGTTFGHPDAFAEIRHRANRGAPDAFPDAKVTTGSDEDQRVASEPFYKAHWRNIEKRRMSAYRAGFNWDGATERLYEPANLSRGQTVVDFGCGPGKIACEIARRVGAGGHVHAIDINAEFLSIARENAASLDVSARLTTHLNDGAELPLDDASTDRITARNALMYVDDPVATLREFHRVLRPGGLAHAIEGDWYMMVAEPVPHDLWRAFVKAASFACATSDMGRKLPGALHAAGFSDVTISIQANADTEGRLLGMIRNMGNYARQSGKIDAEQVDTVVALLEQARDAGRYLAVAPQFVVTGRKPL